MGVQILSPESQKHVRALPRIPKTSHYSMQPVNTVKPSRTLPTVPNANLAKMDPNIKLGRALPRVPKPPPDNLKKMHLLHRHARVLPEVPYKDTNSVGFKDTTTPSTSRTSTPRHSNRDSNILHTNPASHSNHHKHPKGTTKTNTTGNNNNNSSNNNNTSNNGKNSHVQHNTKALPKIPKTYHKPKPEQNRIEYMHELYKKDGDVQSEEGNYEQALKNYNLALKFISDDKSTILARSRVYRKLGKPRKAMQDVDLSLKLDPIYYEGMVQKAELLLEQGDYEQALQLFQKGARMRPDKDDFHDGIEKAKHGMVENSKAPRKRKNTLSPDDNTNKKTKGKLEKAKKNRDNVNVQNQRSNSHISDDVHNNSYGSHGSSSNKETVIMEDPAPFVPAPPTQPPPAMSRARIMNGRQMTPMPGRLKRPAQESTLRPPMENLQDGPPPTEEDIDEDMMKQILGRMYKDKGYLEKLLNETDMPQGELVGPSAENGLHFLYDRVLNWVRKGHAVPTQTQGPMPLPRQTMTSARRKAMMHGSSVESLLEDQEKENEKRMKKKKKKPMIKPKNTWYQYLEHKKVEEAGEKKQSRNIFLHVVEGQQITPKEHSNLEVKRSGQGPETSRRLREGHLKRNKEFDSKESLNQSFVFKSYRPSSDMRNSKETKTSPMDTSDDTEVQARTPPRKTKRLGREKEKEKIERRRNALAKFVTKETEEIECAYADNKYDVCMEKALHVIGILDHEEWPEKYAAMALLYSFLGNAAIGKKDYDGGLRYHGKDLEIGEKNKLDEAVSRALGNLGRIYVVQKKHQEALDVFLRKTPMCASRIETAWLFHEIGNCFLALGDFEYAKDAAKKSLENAEVAVEWSYQLQSCVLMGVAEVKLKQYHAAFNTFEKALDQARLQGDEKAEEAIREALQDVNDRIVEEMRTKGPLNYQDGRPDNFLTPLSRGSTTLTDYQLMGLSRSRAQIMKMEAELGFRCRADYAKTPAAASEYSSIYIPDDDVNTCVSLTESNELNLDLERLRTESTLFGSQMDVRDNIRSDTFVSGKVE